LKNCDSKHAMAVYTVAKKSAVTISRDQKHFGYLLAMSVLPHEANAVLGLLCLLLNTVI